MGSELHALLVRIINLNEFTPEENKAKIHYDLSTVEDKAYDDLSIVQDKLNYIWDLQKKLREKREKLLDKSE